MVILQVKKGDQNLFLYETTTAHQIAGLVETFVCIHNGQLKIERLCYEIGQLCQYGAYLPKEIQGLTPDQISELKLKDKWANIKEDYFACFFKSSISNPDPLGMRNGFAPKEQLVHVLTKATTEARTRVSTKMLERKISLTKEKIEDTIDLLKGAVAVCFPKGLPTYDPVYLELFGKRDLNGIEAIKDVLDENTDLWWAGKRLDVEKSLSDYVGKNEKTKLIVKLQKNGQGAPAREPTMTEEQRKDLMFAEFKRQEELKKLEEHDDDDDTYLDSDWADNYGIKKNIMSLHNMRFK